MPKAILIFLAIIILLGTGAAAAWWFSADFLKVVPTPTPPITSPTPAPITQKNTVVLLQQRESERRIMVCSPSRCQPSVPVESDQGEAVFDGVSWYRYRLVQKEQKKEPALLLERIWLKDNHTEPIVEQTPLVRPRELYISPDGQKVAYWLDNIDQPTEKLTELWVYDAEAGSTRLVVEKVQQENVVSPVRWNRASTHLWFMTHVQDKTQIVTAGVKPVERITTFDQLAWDTLEGVASYGTMDISLSGEEVAYVENNSDSDKLVIFRKPENITYTTVQGTIPYMEWLADGSLLYAKQQASDFTLWRVQGKIHRHVAHYNGTLSSARSAGDGETILLAVDSSSGASSLATLRLSDGYIQSRGSLPAFGEATKIVQILPEETTQQPQVAGVKSTFSDEELVAFIEKQLETIVGTPGVTASRIIMTDQPNTFFVDYHQADENGRVLVTVRDVLNPEWSIRGRYKQTSGDWKKIEGSGLTDPVGKRVYEWEESVKQWIRKSG